jgi:hypothetical protein
MKMVNSPHQHITNNGSYNNVGDALGALNQANIDSVIKLNKCFITPIIVLIA